MKTVNVPPALHAMSSEASNLARTLEAQRLGISEEQIRGVSLGDLLDGGAKLFADGGAAAREDPAGTYALSQPVEQLDYFVSHAWRSSRLAKWLALLCYYNLNAAITAYLVVALVCYNFTVLGFDALPRRFVKPAEMFFDNDTSTRAVYFAEIFAPIAFLLTFFGGHLLQRRGETAFLDIACIDQLDAENKAAGINSLGALLDRSHRMLVLLDENNLQRMWCVFELAAFAKRRSIEHMEILPLHLAMQQGALVFAMLFFTLMGLLPTSGGLCGDQCEANSTASAVASFTQLMLLLPLAAMAMLLLVHATWQGRVTKRRLERLRFFSIADAGCFSDVDRAAITELIGRWFADASHVGADGGDAKMAHDVGVYNFETFVRMEVREKIELALGGTGMFQWPPVLSLLWFLTMMASWFCDATSAPEVTLYHLISYITATSAGLLIGAPAFGLGINLAAAGVDRARDKVGHYSALLLVGVPGCVLAMTLFFVGQSVANPFVFFAGSDSKIGQMTFGSDGLDPASSRRVVKVQVVTLVCVLAVLLWKAVK